MGAVSCLLASAIIQGYWGCLTPLDQQQAGRRREHDIHLVTHVGLGGSCGREVTGLEEVLVQGLI